MRLIHTGTRLPVSGAIALSLLLATAAHPVLAQQTQKQEIYHLLEMHQYQQAEKAATAYLAASPGGCSVNVLLGLALRGEERLEPAFKAFHTAVDRCPQSLAAVEGAAEAAFLLNRPEAKGLLTQVLNLRPGDETTYAMLGAIDAHAGDCTGAVEHYSKSLSHVQQSPTALRQYGGCLLVLDRATEAVPLLTQLLTLKDDNASRVLLARAQEKAGDRPSALATLQPLLGPEARDSEALLLAARIAEAGDDTPRAVAWLRRAIEIAPHNVSAYLFFSEISFNHTAFKVGIDFLNVGIHELPSEARLYLARGVLEVQLSLTDAALRDFEEAHRLDPQLSFVEDALGMLFSQKHDSAAALALFAQQSQLHPNDALLQYLYAEALSEGASVDPALTEKALATARHAVQLEPGYEPGRDLLCVLLLRHNDLDATVAQAEEALRRNPYDEVALYQEVLAEHKLKHAEKTAALVKRLQEAKAHNQQARTMYLLEEAQPAGAASK